MFKLCERYRKVFSFISRVVVFVFALDFKCEDKQNEEKIFCNFSAISGGMFMWREEKLAQLYIYEKATRKKQR